MISRFGLASLGWTWMATKQLFGDVAVLSFIAVAIAIAIAVVVANIEDNSMNSLKSSTW
jgi:hypothetical protein